VSFSQSDSSPSSSSEVSPTAAAPNGLSDFAFRPLISREPVDANEDKPFPFGALASPAKPTELPNVDPPREGLLGFINAPKPLALLTGDLLPANDDSLLPLATANGELGLAAVLPNPLKGDVTEPAKPLKPEDLNLSSDVCGIDSALSESLAVADLEAMAAKGDSADVFAKPLLGGIFLVSAKV